MVLQDTWLFEGTIKENIAYGNLDVIIMASIVDDFDSVADLKSYLYENDLETELTSKQLESISGDGDDNFIYRLGGTYDGSKRKIKLKNALQTIFNLLATR